MKKVIAFVLACVMVISLCACQKNNKIPENMTEETYTQGKNAIKVMDRIIPKIAKSSTNSNWFDVKSEADEKIGDILDMLNAEDLQTAALENPDMFPAVFMNMQVHQIICEFGQAMWADDEDGCRSARDALAEVLEAE